MSIHHEMKRFKDTPEAARALADALRRQPDADWTEWELDFLQSIAERDAREPHSTRQLEKLLELRDASRHYSRIDGFSVAALIRECWIGRLDLADEDEAFISKLKAQSPAALKLRPLKRLIHCSRQLGVIEHFVAI